MNSGQNDDASNEGLEAFISLVVRRVVEQTPPKPSSNAPPGSARCSCPSLRGQASDGSAGAVFRLEGDDADSAGAIMPEPKLRKALAHWRATFPDVGPSLTAMQVPDHPAWDDAEPWLACLRAHPALWQSFDVLDDLVLALADVPAFGVRQTLGDPLLARAERCSIF